MKADRISMQGGGYYNDNCTLQRRAIETYFTTFQPAVLKGSVTRLSLLS